MRIVSKKFLMLWIMLLLLAIPAIHAQDNGSSEQGTEDSSSAPIEVFVNLTVLGVSEFQLDNGVYNVDFLLFLSCDVACTDEELAFDVMGVSGAEGLYIEDRARDEFSAQYRIRATFSQNVIDLSRYPFDAHQLNIILESRNYDISRVVYSSTVEANLIDRNVRIPGWALDQQFVVDLTPQVYGDTEFSRFTMGIPVSRVAGASFIRSILPALIILLISFLGTFMPDRQQRVGLAGGILLAMLVHHLSVAGAIPAVAYPVYFDAFMLLNDGAILVQFIAMIVELVFERRGTHDRVIDRYGYSALGVIILVWLIGQVIVLQSFGII